MDRKIQFLKEQQKQAEYRLSNTSGDSPLYHHYQGMIHGLLLAIGLLEGTYQPGIWSAGSDGYYEQM